MTFTGGFLEFLFGTSPPPPFLSSGSNLVVDQHNQKTNEIDPRSERLPDTHRICYGPYTYTWSLLKQHPSFILTKKIRSGKYNAYDKYEGLYVFNDCCPEIYAYIHRYIVCGAPLDVPKISDRLLCPVDSILQQVRAFGFDETICIGLNQTK